MAKFCSNCGNPLEEEDKVCGMCGTPVETQDVFSAPAFTAQAPAADFTNPGLNLNPGMPNQTKAVSQNAKVGKIIVFSAIGVVALVLLLIVGSIVGKHTGYKGVVNKFVKSLNKSDVEVLRKVASPVIVDYYDDSVYSDFDTFAETTIDYIILEMEDKAGAISKFSYEITDVKEYSSTKLKKAIEQWEKSYKADCSDIKDAYEVKVKLIAKGKDKKTTDKFTMIIVKQDGGWKLLDIE